MNRLCSVVLAFYVSFSGIVFAETHQSPFPEIDYDAAEKTSMFMSETTRFELNIPAEKAIYLFSAEGEKYWVKDWEPSLPRGDGFQKNDVFYVNGYPGKPISKKMMIRFRRGLKRCAKYSHLVS